MKFVRSFFFLLGSLLLIQCSDSKEGFIPGYSGSFGEVVIVVENAIWKSDIGDSIVKYVNPSLYGFPQDEKAFTLIQIPPNKFQSVLRTHRSVIMINDLKEAHVSKGDLQIRKSMWAKGQVVVELNSASRAQLIDLLKEKGETAVRVLQNTELNRQILKNKKFGASTLNTQIQKLTGLDIITQKDWEIETSDSNSIWMRLERERPKGGYQHQISQGLLICWEPYTDKLQFLDSILEGKLNELLETHVPGPGPNQFMQMAYEYYPPISSEINFNEAFGKEIHGMWRMEGNFMGGPFIGISFLDEQQQRVVYLFGYVYSPQFSKREYLREIESIMRSVKVAPNP